MAATDAVGSGRNASAASGREVAAADVLRRRNRLFAQARRHTFLVRFLRVAAPLCILGSFGVYALILKAHFAVGPGTLQFGKIEVTADDLKMKNPSYFGVTQDNGKYVVNAREAIVDMAMTGPVRLEGIDGELVQATGVRTNLKSTRGNLDNKSGELELFDGVDIKTSSGMTAHLIRAMVKTKEHYISSREPLTADMPTGRLTANSMDFWSDKKVAKFSNNITLRLVQPPAGTGTAPAIGLGDNKRQPVDISARDLGIDDNQSFADFHTNVVATQGESQLSAPFLRVTYQGRAVSDGAAALAPATGTAAEPGGGTQLTHLTAYPNVVLTAGTDRRLIADRVDFDVKADSVLFAGNVELRQAKNVFRGGRLAIDRKAGKSRLDNPGATAKAAPGRIAATLVQATDPAKPQAAGKGKPGAAGAPAADTRGAFGDFHSDPGAPTDIEADTLEVNEQTKQAIFKGHVIAKQGDYVINSAELIAHYSGQTGLLASAEGSDTAKTQPAKTQPAKGTPATATPPGAQLTFIETKGGTKIVSKDGKEAEGEVARFDMKANQVLMEGPNGVTLKQGPNLTQGRKLTMDLTKGEAHIENGPSASAAPGAALSPGLLSITAKPGVAPPAQPSNCHTENGQSCMIFHPDQLQQAAGGKPGADGKKAAPPAAATPAKPPVTPQSSPSAVYRSN